MAYRSDKLAREKVYTDIKKAIAFADTQGVGRLDIH